MLKSFRPNQLPQAQKKYSSYTYIKGVTDKISIILKSLKDSIGPLLYPGVYQISGNCGKVYIGMTNRSFKLSKKQSLYLKSKNRKSDNIFIIKENGKTAFLGFDLFVSCILILQSVNWMKIWLWNRRRFFLQSGTQRDCRQNFLNSKSIDTFVIGRLS